VRLALFQEGLRPLDEVLGAAQEAKAIAFEIHVSQKKSLATAPTPERP